MKTVKFFSAILITGLVAIMGFSPVVVHAAGSASFSFSPSGGAYNINNPLTVNLYEDSGAEGVNTVEADLAYADPQAAIDSVTVSTAGSPFTTCLSSTSTSIVCSVLGGSVSGQQFVGSLTLHLKPVGSASVSVTITPDSKILRTSDNANIWNGVATSGSYTFSTPAPAPAPAPVQTVSHSSGPMPAVMGDEAAQTPAPAATKPAEQKKPATATKKSDTTKNTKSNKNNGSQVWYWVLGAAIVSFVVLAVRRYNLAQPATTPVASKPAVSSKPANKRPAKRSRR